MKILFIDTETTGFSHKTQDMWQVAGYITENQKVIDMFNIKCQPINWHTISKGALECQEPPITIKQLKSYQKPREAFLELKTILDKHYDETISEKFFIAGQNVKAFDWRFLNAFWNRHKEDEEPDFQHYFNNRVSYDLMDLTRPLKKRGIPLKENGPQLENVKLGTIIESLDIKIDGPLHDALSDIEGTYKAFYKAIDRWKILLQTDPTLINELSEFIQDLFKRMKIFGHENTDDLDLL